MRRRRSLQAAGAGRPRRALPWAGARARRWLLPLSAAVALTLMLMLAAAASAAPLADDGQAEWKLEQPAPPAPEAGVEASKVPIGLGRIGGISFWSPDRGVLSTAGNGSTVPPGIWEYNGEGWHELATVCGASVGGRVNPPNPPGSSAPASPSFIAWSGPDEFWTISDGRTGQAAESLGRVPPLEDNTLCRFAIGASGALEVVASYASLAFQSTSYLAMNAAACLSPSNCWFGGEPLQAPQIGAFQLHWNGRTLSTEPYLPEGHAIDGLVSFEGHLYESVALKASDRILTHEGGVGEEPALHVSNSEGAFEAVTGMPLLGEGVFPQALGVLHLSADEDALWAAAGPAHEPPAGSQSAQATIVRYSKLQYSSTSGEYEEEPIPVWKQVLGPDTSPSGAQSLPGDVIDAIGAEPGTNAAWFSLESEEEGADGGGPTARATVARVEGDGTVSDEVELPGAGEQVSPKGAAEQIVCPATHDCWMVTTQGWLYHLATASEREHPQRDQDAAFADAPLIGERPEDEGVPQQISNQLPVNDSGEEESAPASDAALVKPVVVNPFATVTVPLLSEVRTRLVHGTTLQLLFHLSVKARMRLLAERHGRVVAKTTQRTFKAGSHSLELRLDVHRWPTKLNLQTHALAPLKTTSTRESNTNVVSTSAAFLNRGALSRWDEGGLLP